MATKVMHFNQKKHVSHVSHHSSHTTKHVVKEHSSRKSSSRSVNQVQHTHATEAMAEPAYTVPAFRQRSADEIEEYQRVSSHVGKGLASIQKELHRMKVATKTQVENIAITREVQEMMHKKMTLSTETDKAPDFMVALRPHTVWEKTLVKLFCTVGGHPRPIVKWYKGGKPVDPLSAPGKYKMESKYGVHSLIISRCVVSDTAEYSAVATNSHGSTTSKASVTVKRPAGGACQLFGQVPHTTVIHHSKLEITMLDRFGVSFGTEGGSIRLVCTMVVVPDLPNVPPLAQWYRDDKLLKAGKLAEIKVGGGAATLTLPHLAKDDEGLYTLRMWTKDGTTEHSAYLFVKDAAPSVAGAPGAPISIKAFDINSDYVLVAWKPPNTTNEAAITGYFVDKRESGSATWSQCNDSPVRICKYPVHGLNVGHAYHFRVRAVNSAGISRPSRESDKVTALDPAERERLQVIKLDGKHEVVIKDDDLEGYVTLPGEPTDMHASEIFKSYIVLSWKPPSPRGRAPLWYIIEKSVSGTGTWQRINTAVKLQSPRYPVFDLEAGKKYQFRVYSENLYGASEASKPTDPIEKVDEHGSERPVGVPSAPGQVVATRNTKSSVFVQWDPPKHPNHLMGYYIDASLVGSKTWAPCNHKPYKHTRFVVHGLTPGETYVFRVQAVNVYGLSDESQESTPIAVEPALTTPSAPHGITMLSCDGASMIIAWNSPKHGGGSKINAYYIDKRDADSLAWKEVNSAPTKTRTYTVNGLTEGTFYEFKVQAGNLAGVGVPSAPSTPLKCEAWTSAVPGPAYDLAFREVRGDSLVILWKAPVYTGASAVTGYIVEMAKKGHHYHPLNEEAIGHCYLQVTGLEAGAEYTFKVKAVNAEGVGKASQTSEPVVAKALPGTQEIQCGVDEDTGDIFLSFEACEISETSNFAWSKNYKEISDCPRVAIETKGKHSKLTFVNPDVSDLGAFSVHVTDTEGVSASHTLTEDALNTMLELSYNIRHPIVPLKHQLNYEVLEKGHVRFWLQCLKMSPAVTYRFIVNDKEVTSSDSHKISHDVNTGVIQMTVDHFSKASEATYTVQIHDGRAKNQSSLVLVGDVFKAALKEAEFQRSEHIRKQGPHFAEYLSYHVDDDCTVLLVCKVANVKKETVFHWFKDEEEIVLETPPNVMSGSVALPISLFSRKDQGHYKAKLSDDRGKDTSVFDISGQVFDDIINAIAHIAGSSASELVLQCTPEGIRLQCYMKYYTEEIRTAWLHKDSKISSSEKMRIAGTAEMAWMQIREPSEKEKGHYSIQIMDATKSHTRTFDLSGQAYTDAYEEYLRLKAAAFAEKNRGRVVGGLPDVVTIMEQKTLSLTCTVWGDPSPEVTWFKNENEVVSTEHAKITLEANKFASLTITAVTSEDSGKYSINVRNKYGGEFVEITVSVYKQGESPPEAKIGGRGATPAPLASKTPAQTPTPAQTHIPQTPTPSLKSPTPSLKSPTPSPKSPTPTAKSPTPTPKSPTPTRRVKSPSPARSLKSPTPPRK
uniref:myomesin-2-like isoform X2 n=1 Tax=Oncorhynchus gorbuscha TaxID=8017 RepID=UPI001EAEADE2|nr:myomesin-2-like isoform X2 [Oncorhynchus gorbuscha]